MTQYDAVLVLSFGGPEGPDDVLPFLENVTRGRGIPRERLVEVGAHYRRFGGISPINEQNRQLIASLRTELDAHGHGGLAIYWGNRNWHPLVEDTVRTMTADGVRSALVFVTSAYSSYSACRQYLEDLERARAAVGSDAPVFTKLRAFFDHPGFVEPIADAAASALAALPDRSRLVFTAHSVPMSMASTSPYLDQLREVARLVAERAAPAGTWDLVFQSRSGPPNQPWLEPDVNDHLRALKSSDCPGVALVPIGFISDHMEVKFDLDVQAAETADEIGLPMVRVATVGTEPRFVAAIRDLIEERIEDRAVRIGLGTLRPSAVPCGSDGCCPRPDRPAVR